MDAFSETLFIFQERVCFLLKWKYIHYYQKASVSPCVVTHVQVCHQNPLSTQDCLTWPMDAHGMSTGYPTLTNQACPTVLSSPTVQWTSMGSPLDIPPLLTNFPTFMRALLSHCPFYPTVPWDSTVPLAWGHTISHCQSYLSVPRDR